MTDKTPATLDRLWDDIPTGPAPIGDIVSAGRAAKRRQRRAILAGTAATTALVLGAGYFASHTFAGPGNVPVTSASGNDLKAKVVTGVAPGVSALIDQPLTDISRGAAAWRPSDQTLVYVPEMDYSGTCPPTATAAATRSGKVTLSMHGYDGGGVCTMDARRVTVTIDGLTDAPPELTVVTDGKTSVIPVTEAGHTLTRVGPNDALAVGESGPMTLSLHCGLQYVSVGEALWETTPRGNGNPPVGLPQRLAGTATRTDTRTIVFTSDQLTALYGSDLGTDQIVFHPATPSDQFVCN
jgi:hypothetical protein